MCTVSVIPPSAGRGLRLAFNRDERRTRAAAWPPRMMSHGDVQAIYPVDPDGGGTWTAAASTGLVFALMNLNGTPGRKPTVPRRSRGHVIPGLLGAANLGDVADRFAALDVDQFAPFRLLAINNHALSLFKWDGVAANESRGALVGPCIASSSSLGDHLVEGLRAELFSGLLAACPDPWVAQDRLHQHAWPDRRHVSVLMSRQTARTVSRTTIVVAGDKARMSYAPVIDGWIGPVITTELPRVAQLDAVCA